MKQCNGEKQKVNNRKDHQQWNGWIPFWYLNMHCVCSCCRKRWGGVEGGKRKEGGRRKWVIFNKCDGTIKYPIWIKCIVGPLSYTIYKNKFQRERARGRGGQERERGIVRGRGKQRGRKISATTDQKGFHGYAKWEKQLQRNDVACNFYRNNKLFCKRMGKTWKDIHTSCS